MEVELPAAKSYAFWINIRRVRQLWLGSGAGVFLSYIFIVHIGSCRNDLLPVIVSVRKWDLGS
ncbi:hypothetical protein NXC24_CH00703 [Rhizobium sp. NXC24]|nr:hypothetical protein NXC24_CH00703 [Rhizobium sp. NXC24]